jgi:hypothetical protein
MPERLDFDSARQVLEAIAPTDTWDEATLRAAHGSLVELDAEDATVSTLRRRPRRSRPPTIGLLAIAACLLAVVALAAVVTADRQSVDTVPPMVSPTECPSTTQPRAITQGAQMNKRFAAPVASAATAILLLGACSDDDSSTSEAEPAGPTTLAKGEDIELVGDNDLGGQTLNIDAVDESGEVTGEFRITNDVITVECADTDTDGVVILGGEVTTSDNFPAGELMFMIIREGDPDSVAIGNNADNAASCTELVESIPDEHLTDDSAFDLLEDGNDIETG